MHGAGTGERLLLIDSSQLSTAVLNTVPVYIASLATSDLTGQAKEKQKGDPGSKQRLSLGLQNVHQPRADRPCAEYLGIATRRVKRGLVFLFRCLFSRVKAFRLRSQSLAFSFSPLLNGLFLGGVICTAIISPSP